jgi:hypothetical protein
MCGGAARSTSSTCTDWEVHEDTYQNLFVFCTSSCSDENQSETFQKEGDKIAHRLTLPRTNCRHRTMF